MSENYKVDGEFTFEQADLNADLLGQEGDTYFLLIDGVKHEARIDKVLDGGKRFKIRAAGEFYMVQVQTALDQLVKDMGLSDYDTQVVGDVEAPMPGRVLEIKVAEGETVEEGTPLMVLEAMKMENILTAVGNGVIEKIHVGQGATVDKGELLIEME